MSTFEISVKMPARTDTLKVTISSTDTIFQVKEKVATVCDTPAESQRLIFAGRVLKDDLVVSECKIESGSTVHVVPIPQRATNRQSSQPTTPTQSPQVPQQNSQPKPQAAPQPNPQPAAGAQPQMPFPFANLFGNAGNTSTNPFGGAANPFAANANMFGGQQQANPFAALFGGANQPAGGGGMGGLFGNLFNNSNMMQQMQQMMQNPQFIQQVMESPMMQQFNQQLLNDPELLRNIISNNPQIRQLMESNPELGHILRDPALLRQALQMSQNPELMREMMRSSDRTMSHIENLPGGFDALRRQYESIVEPFQQAMQMPVPQDSAADSNNSTPPSPVPNSAPLPNPWSANTANNAQPQAPNLFGGMNLFGGLGAQPPAQTPVQPQAQTNPQANTQSQPNPMGIDFNQVFNQMFTNMMTNQLNQQAGAQANPQNPGAQANPLGGMDMFSMMSSMLPNMFNNPNSNFASPSAPVQQQSPEARFAVQLQQLNDMGFNDQTANIRCLTATNGNVNAAIERLLQGD